MSNANLVLTFLDSHKGFDEDAIIVTGDIEPDPTNKPIHRRASGPGLCTLHYLNILFLSFRP